MLEMEAAGDDVDLDLVNTLFRAIHSIKGAAGFMGLTTLSKLSHSLENVLGQVRNLELKPTSAIVDVMLRAADAVGGLVNDVDRSNDVYVDDHIIRLDNLGPQFAPQHDRRSTYDRPNGELMRL